MSVEIDRRVFERGPSAEAGAELVARAAVVSERLPGDHEVEPKSRNRFTGAPQRLLSHSAEPAATAGSSLVARALDHLRRLDGLLASPGEVLEWIPEPQVHRTSSGARLVHLHQVYRGVPVFEAMRTVRFDAAGAVVEVTGDHAPLADGMQLAPELGAADALLAAARHVSGGLGEGLRVSDHPPRRLAALPLPASPSVYQKRPFVGPVPMHLCLFYLGGGARLCWFVALRLPDRRGCYDLLVAATAPDAGEVLWCRRTSAHVRPARGLVFLHSPGHGARVEVAMPAPLADLPPLRPRRPLPAGFPPPWVTDRNTSGGNAVSKRRGKTLGGKIETGRVVFRPTKAEGEDQRVLNAFYHVNYLHDFFYLLGFDETEGNFQSRNPTGVLGGGDRVEIGVFQTVLGEAMMETTADGTPPRLLLGTSAGGRHTALDADVVIHELVHGVTDRIVGGSLVAHPMSRTTQSRALDEGTCDYFALTIQNHRRLTAQPPQSERLIYGEWVGGGARRSYAQVSLRFGDLEGELEEHRAGRVWGAALLAMNRAVGGAVGDLAHGHEIGWQLVVDALKLLEVTPFTLTFLTARDRIYEALELMKARSPRRADGQPLLPPGGHAAVETAVRSAFLALGMGPGATGDGPRFDDVVGDPP